jgi:enamine deaminase RidA (YjgF/YER057c/UK114 family)
MVSAGSSQGAGPERRLQDLGIVLPNVPRPLGAYVEAVQSGSLLFLSGMLPIKDGKPQYIGRLGKELDADADRDALRTATLKPLSAAKEHIGSLDRVRKVVRVGVYLAASGDFYTPTHRRGRSIGACPGCIWRGQDVRAVRLRNSQLATRPTGHARG